MISINLYSEGKVARDDLAVDQISDALHRRNGLLWVDVELPTPDDLKTLGNEFGFHPLALEDVARRHQRPKVDVYDDFLFLVFYVLAQPADDASIASSQMSLFVGRGYLVTVHDGMLPVLAETRRRWSEHVERLGDAGVGILVYSLLDAIVDGYFPLLDAISDRVEELEERIFERYDPEAQREIFRLKHELLAIRRVVAPERDVLNVLLRRDAPFFDESMTIYFQDVYDHTLRVTDAIDTYRDLLSSALDAYLSVTSNRLNRVMKTLTASSIILMGMTLVASVYGMNFVHMPELGWRLGYLWAVGLMTVIGVTGIVAFKRIDWL